MSVRRISVVGLVVGFAVVVARIAALAAGITAATMGAVALAHAQSAAGAHVAVTAHKSDRASSASVDIAYALARGRDGKLVAGGLSADRRNEVALARYALDGRLDRNFGIGGRVLGLPGPGGRPVAIQTDDKLGMASAAVYVQGSRGARTGVTEGEH